MRTNYEGKYKDFMCPANNLVEDTQPHLMECVKLSDKDLVDKVPEYDDLFGKDLKTKVITSRILRQRYQRRKEIERKQAEDKTSQTNLAQVIQM